MKVRGMKSISLIVDRLLAPGLFSLFALASLVPYQFLPREGLVSILRLLPPALALGTFLLWVLKRPSLSGVPLSIPVVAAISFNLLGCLGAPDLKLALSRLGYYAITGMLLYLVSADTFRTRKGTSGFILFAVAVAAVVALYGVLEFLRNSNPLSGSVFSQENPTFRRFGGVTGGRPRISATIGHPVYVAAYLVLTLPLALHLFVRSKDLLRKVCSGFVLMLMFAALFFTFARGGWVASLVALFLYLRSKGRRALVFWLAGVSIFVGAMLTSGKIRGIVKSRDPFREIARELRTKPSGGRMDAYRVAGEIVSERPLFGVGTANYRLVARKYGDINETPDNMYLRLIYENGILGFGAVVFIFWGMLKNLKRCREKSGAEGDLALAFTAALAGFLVDMVTNDALAFPTTRIAFWTLAGVAMGGVGGREHRSRGDRKQGRAGDEVIGRTGDGEIYPGASGA